MSTREDEWVWVGIRHRGSFPYGQISKAMQPCGVESHTPSSRSANSCASVPGWRRIGWMTFGIPALDYVRVDPNQHPSPTANSTVQVLCGSSSQPMTDERWLRLSCKVRLAGSVAAFRISANWE